MWDARDARIWYNESTETEEWKMEKKKKKKPFTLHASTARLLLWGLRILVPVGALFALYIGKNESLPLWQAKEMISALLISAWLLLTGAMILDTEEKKKEK